MLRSSDMAHPCRAILLAALLVAGCSSGSRIWQRPDTSAEQTRADEAACIRPASSDPARPGEGLSDAGRQQGGPAGVRTRQAQIDTCMEGLGYRLERANAAAPTR